MVRAVAEGDAAFSQRRNAPRGTAPGSLHCGSCLLRAAARCAARRRVLLRRRSGETRHEGIVLWLYVVDKKCVVRRLELGFQLELLLAQRCVGLHFFAITKTRSCTNKTSIHYFFWSTRHNHESFYARRSILTRSDERARTPHENTPRRSIHVSIPENGREPCFDKNARTSRGWNTKAYCIAHSVRGSSFFSHHSLRT